MKEEKNSDRMAVIDNYNFCDTHTHKWTSRLYDRPGPEGRGSEKLEKETALSIKHPTECKKIREQDIYLV